MQRFDLSLSLTATTYIPPLTNRAVCGAAADHKQTDNFCEILSVRTDVRAESQTSAQRTNLSAVESVVLCNRTRCVGVCGCVGVVWVVWGLCVGVCGGCVGLWVCGGLDFRRYRRNSSLK